MLWLTICFNVGHKNVCKSNGHFCAHGSTLDLEVVPSIELETIFFENESNGSRDGAVVRALASHQCGPGSILGLGVICGLNLLLVLVPAPRVFLRVLQFSSLHKNQHFQIPCNSTNSNNPDTRISRKSRLQRDRHLERYCN